jgi:hypothetical protein
MPGHRLNVPSAIRDIGLATLLVASLVSTVTAQQDPCLDRTVAVNVLTEKGDSVNGLTAKSFRAEYQRQLVEVVSATRDIHTRRIAIVLDTSRSINQNLTWYAATSAAKRLYSTAPGETSFALLTFATQVETRIELTEGRVAVAKALSAMGSEDWTNYKGPTRKTALLDALVEGLGSFPAPALGDVVFAITDGDDNASHIDFSEVRRKFLSTGVRLFCFLVSEPLSLRGRTREEASGPEEMAQLVRATGGDFTSVELDPQGDLAKFQRDFVPPGITSLEREIAETYRVEIHLPQSVDKEKGWKLQVVDDSGKSISKLRIIYPQKLAPCP